MLWWSHEMRLICMSLLLAALTLMGSVSADSLHDLENYRPLTADRKALRIGDNITVLVIEAARAEASAGRATDRRTEVSADASVTRHTPQSLSLGLSGGQKNNGGMQRSGAVRASITATVVDIDPGGRLHLAGRQEIYIDGEQQSLVVEGKVRPIDVSHDNVVLSTRLADAHIEYLGDGGVARAKKSNWFQRLLAGIGLM